MSFYCELIFLSTPNFYLNTLPLTTLPYPVGFLPNRNSPKKYFFYIKTRIGIKVLSPNSPISLAPGAINKPGHLWGITYNTFPY